MNCFKCFVLWEVYIVTRSFNWQLAGAIAATIVLTACGETLNAVKIEESIQQSITQQGGTSLKSVICPQNIKPAEGQVFECVGVLDSGSGFAIPVTQQDSQGGVQWDVPSVKGLLNMDKIQSAVQDGLKKEVGQVSIDCGSGVYKAAKPGEVFECKLVKRDGKSADPKSSGNQEAAKPDAKSDVKLEAKPGMGVPIAVANPSGKIQVTIEPSGDISWQRIIEVQVAQASPASSPSSTASPTPSPSQALDKATPKESPGVSNAPATPTETAGKSAEESLNESGTDNIED
ncbi:MAG: DUF4333 domain-containing protein [Leptolyngbyaceae cyanobacterium CSU_1_3]|nr:DUF4333 domain-containing protein [Leptolyngbyaceae cyanobacterium CSU_1_3]